MDVVKQAEQELLKKRIKEMPIKEIMALFPEFVAALEPIFKRDEE